MANFTKCGDNFKISIPRWDDIEKCTFYEVRVDIGEVFWTVSRRYSEFVKLHEALVNDHGVTNDILPPKKVIGNRDEAFIEKRRRGLEVYLATIVRFLQIAMPKQLAVFLNFHKFEIFYIVKDLAVLFFMSGEAMLTKAKKYIFSSLQIYAINERLKQPSTDLVDQREDFSHVLDFCCQLTGLTVEGSDVPIPNSNIVPNELTLNFSAFKALEQLSLHSVNCNHIGDLGSLRFTLKKITVEGGSLISVKNLILCDQTHKDTLETNLSWTKLTQATICKTNVRDIDKSVKLLPHVQSLTMEDNQLERIDNLDSMPHLSHISLRSNRISLDENFELKAANLVSIDLSQNFIFCLKPFSKLYSLETLILQSNKVSDILEVRHIADLPCLENLVLSGNPVSIIVDYRVKVLEYYGRRAFQLCLDNESTNQKELDKVAILKALRASKEGHSYVNVSP